jgi:hypothetical protein
LKGPGQSYLWQGELGRPKARRGKSRSRLALKYMNLFDKSSFFVAGSSKQNEMVKTLKKKAFKLIELAPDLHKSC